MKTREREGRLMAALVKAVGAMLEAFRTELRSEAAKQADAFNERIGALEGRDVLSYRGVWKSDALYERGNFVTFNGALWHCDNPGHDCKPGVALAHWTLAVKSGRDKPGAELGNVVVKVEADVAEVERMLAKLEARCDEVTKRIAELTELEGNTL